MAAAAVIVLAGACSGVGTNLPASAPDSDADAASLAMAPAADVTPEAPPAPPPGDAVIAPPPEHFEGPPPPRKAPPRQLTSRAPKAGGTWAVVIGINDYPGTAHDLRSAVADADYIVDALAGMGVPADHRLVLKDGQATKQVLRSAAQWLVDRAGPDAVGVFAFAGHVRKAGPGTEAMVAADGGIFADAELAGVLRGLEARRSWVVMAACYGGGFTEVLRPGTVLTGAAPADKEAYENVGLGSSYLVHFMVLKAMIERRADDTVQTAFEYARAAISQEYRDRVPVQFEQGGGPLDLRPPGTPRPPPASQKGSQPPSTTTTTAPSGTQQTAGDSPSRSSTTTTTAPPQDQCRDLTRIVRCPTSD